MHANHYYYYYCNSWTNQTHYCLLYLTKNPIPHTQQANPKILWDPLLNAKQPQKGRADP